MAVFNPTMNPLRFYRYNNDPDFQDEWPNYENIRQREQYFDGMYATNFYKDWIVNKEMVLQFRISSGSTTIVITLPDGSTTTIAPTNISPSAWTGVQIYKYSYTPTIEGVYQMAFFDASWISDKFITHSSEKFRRRLIEVQFYNETNDYGMIFESDYSNPGTFANVYTGLNYYTGKLNLPIPKNEKSIYESDRGVLTTLRSTPIKSCNLVLTDIHKAYLDQINFMFSCDNLIINGLTYQTSEAPSIDDIGKSDLVNVSVEIQQINTYFAN